MILISRTFLFLFLHDIGSLFRQNKITRSLYTEKIFAGK